jgi:hypothetical protein
LPIPAHAHRAALILLFCTAVSHMQARAAQSELVLVKPSTAAAQGQYHRPSCPVVRDGKDVLAMTRAEAESRGYKSHRDCDPAQTPAHADGKGASAAPVAPEPSVVVDAAGKYYHQRGCSLIGKEPRTVLLKDAGKRWPCPTCKPPIRKRADPLVSRWRG